ncbi:MAG: DUF5688 family protein [Lachnospiraceae bacterium]|nr:DUF5688 family protein [Lachnospiraceae bacterium]
MKKNNKNTATTGNSTISGGNDMNTINNNTNITGENDMMDNNYNFGGINMENNNITALDVFAGMVKVAVADTLGEGYEINVNDMLKNNSTHLTGICIRKAGNAIAPNIYLNGLFEHYQNGEIDMQTVCDKVLDIYRNSELGVNFDVDMINEFSSVRNRLCYKLVNADYNAELLADAPHRIVCGDLAVIYTIIVSQGEGGIATITVRNDLFKYWGITEERMFGIALDNTQRMFRGTVDSIQNVLRELVTTRMDISNSCEFFDMCASESDMVPLYVATNQQKLDGAGVMLYDGLLREFAKRTGSDAFYIIPSSIHEILLIPMTGMMRPEELKAMVREVNATQVAPQDVLSDSVYKYSLADDTITRA